MRSCAVASANIDAALEYSMSPPLFPTALSASFAASAAEASSIESALIAVSAKTAILFGSLQHSHQTSNILLHCHLL